MQSERLELRPLEHGDLDDMLEIWADPVAMRYYPSTRNREQLLPLLERSRSHFERDRTGFYAMVHRESGEWIGQCGLLWQDVDGVQELEIGYQCKPRHWRRGYSSEAALRLRRFAFEELDRDHVISLVRPVNRASAGVALKMGMRIWKQSLFKGLLVNVYRVDRSQIDG